MAAHEPTACAAQARRSCEQRVAETDGFSQSGSWSRRAVVLVVVGLTILIGGVLLSASAARADRHPHPKRLRQHPVELLPLGRNLGRAFEALEKAEEELPESQTEQSQSARITVPFYMYDPNHFAGFQNCSKGLWSIKHAIDYLFLQRLENHAWRVRRPEDAELFVVPVLLSTLAAEGKCKVGLQEGITQMKRYLAGSTWFTEHDGRDHLILMPGFQKHAQLLNLLGHNLIIGSYTRDDMRDHANVFVVGFLDHYASLTFNTRNASGYFSEWNYRNSAKLPRDLVVRWMGSNRYWNGSPIKPRLNRKALFEVRDTNATREVYHDVFLTIRDHFKGSPPQAPHCNGSEFMAFTEAYGSLPCVGESPVLNATLSSWVADRCVQPLTFSRQVAQRITERAHFSFVLYGDNPESDTLYNSIAGRSIPVLFVEDAERDHLYECMAHFDFPWKDIVLVFSGSEFRRDPMRVVQHLRHLVASEPDDLARRVETIDAYARDIVWSEPDSRVHESILIDAWRHMKGTLPRRIDPPKMHVFGEQLNTERT
ncbi:hypothetical protein FVE85_9499 [Porphyridium purpureum]|uniref:Exostosin GT47 domain-containing protein n=1 Tax=Porphyridium purpureum TaxID=35688 RepID=A0A5J4YKG0_PORPP|nr:hypothetical protein FVE85_9499 [Porphyridium purpureum]|eukprot:POR3210..scf261_15